MGILVVSQRKKVKERRYSKSEMCAKKNKGGRKGRQRKINEQMETKPAGE